ncbi:MAG: ribbon-helix-helix domain-containing protein [Candidatus Hodarchaeota archaeon]
MKEENVNEWLKLVTVKMPETYIKGLDALVEVGLYPSRSEAIREAIRYFIRKETWHKVPLGKISSL